MSMHHPSLERATLLILLLAPLAACDSQLDTGAACGDPVVVAVTYTTADGVDPSTPLTGDASFAVSVRQVDDVPIDWVEVAGVPASPPGDDSTLWTATVPFGMLLDAEQPAGDTGLDSEARTIEATASDILGCTGTGTTLVRVDATPDDSPSSLEVTLSLPEDATVDYLPADGSAWARVDVVAPITVIGGTVSIEPSGGTLADSDGSLGLAAGQDEDGQPAAVATTWVKADAAGRLLVTATVGSVTSSDELSAADAPTFSAADQDVPTDLPTRLVASSQGEISECRAVLQGSGTVEVELAGAGPLLADGATTGWVGLASPSDLAEIVVTWPAEAAETATVQLQCRDPWLQAGETTLTASQEAEAESTDDGGASDDGGAADDGGTTEDGGAAEDGGTDADGGSDGG